MAQIVVTPQEMREIDRITIEEVGVPGIVLMENAGRGVAGVIQSLWSVEELRVVVLSGRGNNGGDGFVTARYLLEKVQDLRVFLLGERARVQGDARFHMELLERAGGIVEEITEERLGDLERAIRSADLLVDAVLGTGFSGDEITGLYGQALEVVNRAGIPVVAVDIPSGVNGATGQAAPGAVAAVATVTMGLPKTGHFLYPGVLYTGDLYTVDIGIPPAVVRPFGNREVVETEDVAQRLPRRVGPENKGDFGRVLIVAGSRGFTGAAVLAARAALRAGAGLVYVAVPESLMPVMETKLTEAIKLPVPELEGRVVPEAVEALQRTGIVFDAVAVGPGLGRTPQVREFLQRFLEWYHGPLVVDADAFVLLYEDPERRPLREVPPVLTPHPGELGRVASMNPRAVNQNRLFVAEEQVGHLGGVLVLKGKPTVIATPEGHTYLNLTGNPGMASGGTGDVLTGLIAALLGQGLSPEDAAVAGVFLHGLAGDLAALDHGEHALIASDLVRYLPQAFQRVLNPETPGEEA